MSLLAREGLVALTPKEVARLDLHHSQPARPDPSKRIYLVGVFHELHCLVSSSSVPPFGIPSHCTRRADDRSPFIECASCTDHSSIPKPEFSIRQATSHHTMHGDVLRQALLCAADSTLIPKAENFGWSCDWGELMCQIFEASKDCILAHDHISK